MILPKTELSVGLIDSWLESGRTDLLVLESGRVRWIDSDLLCTDFDRRVIHYPLSKTVTDISFM